MEHIKDNLESQIKYLKMKRKEFIKNGMIGLSAIVAAPMIISSCNKEVENPDPNACVQSPKETAGPFPIKTPAELVRENIIGNRSGIPLMFNIIVQNVNDSCKPLEGVLVDVWHCDAKGNYSEYSGQLDGDFTSENFLRGRQTTASDGKASFISIFPGWYPGRTPHIHIEVKSNSGKSLLVSQISWDDNISNKVYASQGYNGNADTNNSNDGIVSDANLADSLTGNNTDGYILTKTIKVKA